MIEESLPELVIESKRLGISLEQFKEILKMLYEKDGE
jgi:DNA-binding transcriptional regulator YhcF (GntR family)